LSTRRLTTALTALAVAILVTFGLATPAFAVTIGDKLAVMSDWSQPISGSFSGWYGARQHQSDWSAYAFDWSTDYCSASPDEPLGFDFRLPCARHDFGYRNFKHVGAFPANKDHVDSAFYFDLKAKCATYSAFVRPACYSLAWTYYEAVHNFGSVVI